MSLSDLHPATCYTLEEVAQWTLHHTRRVSPAGTAEQYASTSSILYQPASHLSGLQLLMRLDCLLMRLF